jgi:hypothetical protein
MGTATRKHQGKKAATMKDLPIKAKRAGETKGGASNGINRLIVVTQLKADDASEKDLKDL